MQPEVFTARQNQSFVRGKNGCTIETISPGPRRENGHFAECHTRRIVRNEDKISDVLTVFPHSSPQFILIPTMCSRRIPILYPTHVFLYVKEKYKIKQTWMFIFCSLDANNANVFCNRIHPMISLQFICASPINFSLIFPFSSTLD